MSISPTLSLVKTTDLDFGSHFATDGVVVQSTTARWDGTTDPQNLISLSFTLPTTLARVGGGDPGVPITYGATSVAVTGAATVMLFDPNTGLASYGPILSPGDFSVRMGLDPSDGDAVKANLSGHAAGSYLGTITLTITVL